MTDTTPISRRLVPAVLILILAMAAGLRFYNLNWDEGTFAHPDERSTVAYYAPTIHWPEDTATLLDPRASTLNPFWDTNGQSRRSYTYGHFPLYTLVLVAHALKAIAPFTVDLLPPAWVTFLAEATTVRGFTLIGRALAALSDLCTVYLLFLLGRRLYGAWAGLLAAGLSAFTVLQIQLSHFFAVDPISTTFTLLALYGATQLYDRQSKGAALLTSVGIALAVASKFSALPIAFAPVLAGYLAVAHAPASHKSRVMDRMIALGMIALAVAVILFALTSPFVLLDFESFSRAVLQEQGDMVSGVADMPFTRQYRNTYAYWYFIEQQVRWGMGWPLGLLGLASLGWVLVRAIRGRAQPGEWLVLGWLVLYFGPTGLFLAKFMRYMAPVVPFLTLFGAGLATAAWRLNRKVGGALAGVTLFASAVWALAFANGVYGTPHTWVTFAHWTYANVPDGSCIAWEHWDDRQPTDLPEPGGTAGAHHYQQPQLPMYEEDTSGKYEYLRQTLMNCDYIVLATNRLWRTVPGLPERYPLSSRYYEALFSGELGFEQVYTAETPPRLGPLVIDDQPADESFTVYDHPKPMMFHKTRQLSPAEWDALLGGTWEGAIPGYVGSPTLLMRLRGAGDREGEGSTQLVEAEVTKSLLLETPLDQLPVVNDFRWNSLANNSTSVAIGVWWLAVTLLGLLAFPLTFWLFHKLPDRGYGLARSLGLLLVGYFVWINSSLGLLSNSLPAIILAVLLLFGVGAWAALKQHQPIVQFWRERWRGVLAAEILFGVLFLFFVTLRLLNPDLWQPWQGGEKMFEIGFLNAIVKSALMPPYDPFFAGGIINYYYYGLFLIGLLSKLTGIEPSIAFNLAVPTLAALTALNVFSLAGNLGGPHPIPLPKGEGVGSGLPSPPGRGAGGEGLRRGGEGLLPGLLAVLFVVFMGNLQGAIQFLNNLAALRHNDFETAIPGLQMLVMALGGAAEVAQGMAAPSYNYWDPSRVIPNTINEFPYWSFLFADLHPHMIGIPFTVLLLSLAYNWLRPDSAPQPIDPQPINPHPNPLPKGEGVGSALPSPRGRGGQGGEGLLPKGEGVGSALPSPRGRGGQGGEGLLRVGGEGLLRWLALPFVLGALAVINTWDLPTYLGLTVTAFLLGRYRRLEGALTRWRGVLLLGGGLLFAVALLGATYLLYAPFFLNYQAIGVGVGLVHTQTDLGQHLKIWGIFLFVLGSWLWLSLLYPGTRNSLLRLVSLLLRRWNVGPRLAELHRRLVAGHSSRSSWAAGAVPFIVLGLALLGYHVPAYLLPLTLLAFALLFRREASPAVAYITLLCFTGLLLLLGVEVVFLRDFLGGGDYYRMNTLFKFYTQVWVMFGVAAGASLPQVWRGTRRWPRPLQIVWGAALLMLLLAGLVFFFLGTPARVKDRFPGDANRPPVGTLDGLAYMSVGSFVWPDGNLIELKYDYEAIKWLQENVPGTPILAEAKVGYYREGGMRVAAYTGLPLILGGLHQDEQRYPWQVGQRDMPVREFWTNPDPARTRQLLDELGITYIYVGQLERSTYGDLDKFEQLRVQGALELVFENEQTKIYKRP